MPNRMEHAASELMGAVKTAKATIENLHGVFKELAREHGEVEALLRREGLYSSHLTAWRKQLELHGSEALAGRKPGRKPKLDAKDRRIAELELRATRLEAKLSIAEKLIDLQKKVSAILGISLATDGES